MGRKSSAVADLQSYIWHQGLKAHVLHHQGLALADDSGEVTCLDPSYVLGPLEILARPCGQVRLDWMGKTARRRTICATFS